MHAAYSLRINANRFVDNNGVPDIFGTPFFNLKLNLYEKTSRIFVYQSYLRIYFVYVYGTESYDF